MDDNELVERLRRGDAGAIDEVIRRYADALTRFAARYTGVPDAADDVVQETFVSLWMRRHELTIRSSLRSYLFTAVRNRLLNLGRDDKGAIAREQAAASALLEEVTTAADDPTVSDDAVVQERVVAEAVRAAVDALPDRIRQAALLRWQDGLSRPEVAEIMGVSVSTVNNQLTVAARRLRLLLQELQPKGTPRDVQ